MGAPGTRDIASGHRSGTVERGSGSCGGSREPQAYAGRERLQAHGMSPSEVGDGGWLQIREQPRRASRPAPAKPCRTVPVEDIGPEAIGEEKSGAGSPGSAPRGGGIGAAESGPLLSPPLVSTQQHVEERLDPEEEGQDAVGEVLQNSDSHHLSEVSPRPVEPEGELLEEDRRNGEKCPRRDREEEKGPEVDG